MLPPKCEWSGGPNSQLRQGKKRMPMPMPSMPNKDMMWRFAPWARGLFRHYYSTETECFITARYHAHVGSCKCNRSPAELLDSQQSVDRLLCSSISVYYRTFCVLPVLIKASRYWQGKKITPTNAFVWWTSGRCSWLISQSS